MGVCRSQRCGQINPRRSLPQRASAIINPDVIALRIADSNSESPPIIEAGKIAVRERAALLAQQASFAIETTLSGNGEIRVMREASAAGYKVNLVFVGVDIPETSVSRVAHRVRMGLHFVPAEDILRRYGRSMENLPVAMRIAHRCIIVDNTGKGFRLLFIRDQRRKPTVAKRLPPWMLKAVPEEQR